MSFCLGHVIIRAVVFLSHNEWFCIKLEKTKEGDGAVRWQRGEVALLFCVITACG